MCQCIKLLRGMGTQLSTLGTQLSHWARSYHTLEFQELLDFIVLLKEYNYPFPSVYSLFTTKMGVNSAVHSSLAPRGRVMQYYMHTHSLARCIMGVV